MIGKGFVLFKQNSSPSAFYIINPTRISWLVFKVSNYFKNCRKVQTRRFVYILNQVTSDDVISAQNQNILLVCVESGIKFNIWDVVSAV